jgi:hypothetical protein
MVLVDYGPRFDDYCLSDSGRRRRLLLVDYDLGHPLLLGEFVARSSLALRYRILLRLRWPARCHDRLYVLPLLCAPPASWTRVSTSLA